MRKIFNTPGAADTEFEQFWRMDMVDMVITKMLLSDRKSRSVNISVQLVLSGLALFALQMPRAKRKSTV